MSAEAEIAVLKERMDMMEKTLETVSGDVKAIRSKTDRWSGIMGLVYMAVPTAAAGAIGWFVGR